MNRDAFSRCHPLVNFLFFLGAIGFAVVIQHPAYIAASFAAAAGYYMLLKPRTGWKLVVGMIPVFLFVSAINPRRKQVRRRFIINMKAKKVRWAVWAAAC